MQVGMLAWQRTREQEDTANTQKSVKLQMLYAGAQAPKKGSFVTWSDGVQHSHGAARCRERRAHQVDRVSQPTRGRHCDSIGSEVGSKTSRSCLHGTRSTGGYPKEPCPRPPQVLSLARPIVPPTILRTGGTLLGLSGTQGSRTVHEMHIEVFSPVIRVPGGSFRNRTAP